MKEDLPYGETVKREALRRVELGVPDERVAAELGIGLHQLRRWVTEAKKREQEVTRWLRFF